MNFSTAKVITTPEGNVVSISAGGQVMWQSETNYNYKKLIQRTISGSYVDENIENVGDRAFIYCTLLKTVDMHSVKSIGDLAFNNCSSLATVILRSETMCVLANTNAFSFTLIASGEGYIYVPSILIDSYKSDSVWSTYANQFRAIEDYPDVCGGEAI